MNRTTPPPRPHPYIPNAVPEARAGMLAALGIESTDDLYAAIPERLRLRRPLDLPPALTSEADLVRHVERIAARNTSTRDVISFLGAGCYEHHVPAVCDEVGGRSEFLTAYAGEPYEDHGRFQALFEYASMMGELLEMDVVNVPTYDGFQAAATALRMAARATGRRRLVLAGAVGADKRSKIQGYVAPDLDLVEVEIDPRSGQCDLARLASTLGPDVAAVYLENPNYLGVVEAQAGQATRLAHEVGALAVMSVDPTTLGVLASPSALGADIACGDIQGLGMHQHFGGGQAGFIATADDPRLVMEFPSRLFGVAPTRVEGEYGFGDVAYERTSFAIREEGKEWVGTAAALWGITAGVYLALLGPQGMAELGEAMLVRTRYAMAQLAAIPRVSIPFQASHHVHEFVVDFSATGRTVAEINRQLLSAGIFGGADLSAEFPALGQSALYAVTEVRTKQDIDDLAKALTEVLA
ncbi:MAG TPA: aminomethyl-transferring glycine dehydrogenase subunit GcvPA [Candidatus Limnocylindrales bacterium]|nr:aminomethyl-transferring glycine dehydrogenase subunit GcvPA [Candidatus Limnocylindrales bacterium]